MMNLSIVVVNWNTRERLAGCLASVYDCPPPGEFEVWVVDNASTDGSVEMVCSQYSQVRLMVNPANFGFARANNQAIRESSARYVLLLNPDAALLPATLETMLDWLERHPGTGVVGATLLNPDGSFQASHGDFPGLVSRLLAVAGLGRWVFGSHFPSHGPSPTGEPVRADWVGGACLMARRAAIDAVGLLDEAYFLYAEEMDWCYRMRQAGWEVAWLPAARCRHWGGQSSRQAQLQTPARLAGAACLFFKKHYGRGYVLLFRAGVVAVGVARALVYTVLYLGSRGQRVDWKHKTTANWRLAAAGWGPCESSI